MTPTEDHVRQAAEVRQVKAFLQIIEDFGSMGTGAFRSKYPDCGQHEGYAYLQRKGCALRTALSQLTASKQGEGK